MKAIPLIRIIISGVFISFLVFFPSSANAQTAVLQRANKERAKQSQLQQTAPEGFTLCFDDIVSFVIIVSNGPSNSTVTFDVFQNPSGILGLATTASGPFSEGITVPVSLDGAGNGTSAPFFVKAIAVGETTFSACSAQVGCIINPQTVAVVNVASLEFEAIDSPLDNNPNAGGGLRIFPDKQTATDTVNRRRVRVKATISSPRANVPIFFRSFDVDDPSSNSSPVDPNGSSGNDNRGNPQNGTLSAASMQTDSNGVAQVEFTVTMQPGDNFKVAAACNAAYLNGVVINGVDLRDANGNTLPTDRAKVTSLLTVWRRVHIEMDSMGNVAGNNVVGTVLSAHPNNAQNRTRLVVDQNLEGARFEDGRITIAGAGSFTVRNNTQGSVTIQGIVQNAAAAGQSFTLVDDDDFNNDDGANLDGDDGENVTAPDTSLIQDSDNPAQNVFAPAYVRPTYDVGDSNDAVPFVLNTSGSTATDLLPTYDFDAMGTEADNDFWTVYLLGAYQHVDTADSDPAREPAILGIVDNINGVGASVFNEILRAAEITITAVVNNSATTAHEIGHLFNGLHRDGGLMAQSSTRTTVAFSDDSLAKIRSLSHP